MYKIMVSQTELIAILIGSGIIILALIIAGICLCKSNSAYLDAKYGRNHLVEFNRKHKC